MVRRQMGFPGGSVVKNVSAKQEMRVWPLGREDPLKEEMATHSGILAWEVPWTEEPVGYSPWGCKESDATWQLDNTNQVSTWKDVHHSQESVSPLCCRSVGKVLVSFHHHLDHSNSHYFRPVGWERSLFFNNRVDLGTIGQKGKKRKIITTSGVELAEEDRWKIAL